MSGPDPSAAHEPVVSVIVPVYGVEQYLRECLDSLLADPAAPIEVIAIDDASPDRSGEILAGYAARDARLRVVTQTTNAGVAAARNVGVELAVGDYIWFVDSDDWLTPGALALVLDRVGATTPDVLVVGYERVFSDGRRSVDRLVVPGPELPETFTAQDQPRILTTLTLACNKVIRREFLAGLGLRWGAGWYEDVAYTKPLLLAADRIGVIEQVCYGYRQRPEGATTSTVSVRHAEVFDQWQHVLDFAAGPEYEDLRPLIFQRMILHYLGVLNHPNRVPRQQRRAFFGRIVSDYRRLRPAAGYPRPSGTSAITFALVAVNAFALFEVLRAVYRTRTQVGRGARAIVRGLRHAYYRRQRRRPLEPTATVFATGGHDGYAGSPHAIPVATVVESARASAAGRPVILVLADPTRSTAVAEAAFAVDSRSALRAFARSQLIISDGPLPAPVVLRSGQQHVLLTPTPPVVPVPVQRAAPSAAAEYAG